MRLEIHSAANFLVQLLRLRHNGLTEIQLEMFKNSLTEVLRRRYKEHWFPEKPTRGSGYRCLRINGKMDPVIAQAGIAVGLPSAYLHTLFPSELTMWIDPAEVSYRIGENGSICVLYEDLNSSCSPDPVVNLSMERVTKADGVRSVHSIPSNNGNSMTSSASSGCKGTLRNIELYLDPRAVQPFEQLAAYVSS